jgi:hypothetical protein
MDTSFKNVQELESYLHIPVTCALPLIVLESERQQEKKRNRRWYCLYVAWFVILIIAAVAFWIRGMIII